MENFQELMDICVDTLVHLHVNGKEFVSVFLGTMLYCVWNIRNGKIHGRNYGLLKESNGLLPKRVGGRQMLMPLGGTRYLA